MPSPATGDNGQFVQYEEFGTRLNCQPTVLADGMIRLEVEPEFSEVTPANDTIRAARTSQRVHTIADVAPGQALVICGPKMSSKSRLVVIVTPSVIDTAAAA